MADTQRHQPAVVRTFLDAVSSAAVHGGKRGPVTRDVASAVLGDAKISVPGSFQALLSKFDEPAQAVLLDGVMRGCDAYRAAHGVDPDPTTVDAIVHSMVPRSAAEIGAGLRLDSATSAAMDPVSLNPILAATSIMAMFAEAIPYAAYLPADIKSNEARLAIMNHRAGSSFGDYASGASLDGIAGGGTFLDSERMLVLSTNGGGGTALTGQVKARTDGSGAACPVLRGRTVVLVNGIPSARASESYSGATDAISGTATVAGTDYTITGTMNHATGAVSITSSPALPAGVHVAVLAYIDFEAAPALAPLVSVDAVVYKMFARASRGLVQTSIDAMTQMQQELSLDPRGQALFALRNQYAQERFYGANNKLKLVAENNSHQWDYDYSTQIAQKDLAQIWLNLQPVLGKASQQMANDTSDHGITTLFLTGELAAQARGLPRDIWEPSGVQDRPGIYRLGRLFNQYDCYYTPKGLTEAVDGSTSEILAVGRATEAARNPIVLGDAVAPVFLPLAMGSDMKQGDGFYTRNFTEVNPHQPSARGAALIEVINIK